MADPKPADDFVRIPRSPLEKVVAFLQAATRRLADTPGVETQALAIDGESVLLELVAEVSRADLRLSLWGPGGRPTLPTQAKANRLEQPAIPAEVKT